MLAYLAGPRVGAAAYNAAHVYVLPLTLLVVGFVAGLPAAMAGALIWRGVGKRVSYEAIRPIMSLSS